LRKPRICSMVFQHPYRGEARVLDRAAPYVRRDHKQRRAMSVDVIGPILGVALHNENCCFRPVTAMRNECPPNVRVRRHYYPLPSPEALAALVECPSYDHWANA